MKTGLRAELELNLSGEGGAAINSFRPCLMAFFIFATFKLGLTLAGLSSTHLVCFYWNIVKFSFALVLLLVITFVTGSFFVSIFLTSAFVSIFLTSAFVSIFLTSTFVSTFFSSFLTLGYLISFFTSTWSATFGLLMLYLTGYALISSIGDVFFCESVFLFSFGI